jgi:hypothetical protein
MRHCRERPRKDILEKFYESHGVQVFECVAEGKRLRIDRDAID